MNGVAMSFPLIFVRPDDAEVNESIEISGHRIRRHPLGPRDRKLTSSLSDVTKFKSNIGGRHGSSKDTKDKDLTVTVTANRHDLSHHGNQIKDTGSRSGYTHDRATYDGRQDLADKCIQVNHRAIGTLTPLHVQSEYSYHSPLDSNVTDAKTTSEENDNYSSSGYVISAPFRNHTKKSDEKEKNSRSVAAITSESVGENADGGVSIERSSDQKPESRDGKHEQDRKSAKWPSQDSVSYLRRTASTPSDIYPRSSSGLRRLAVLQNLAPIPPSLAHIPWMPNLSQNKWAKHRFIQSLEYPFKIQNPVLDFRKSADDIKTGSNKYMGKKSKIQALGEFGHNVLVDAPNHHHHFTEHKRIDSNAFSGGARSVLPSRPSYTHRPSFQPEHLSHPIDEVFGKVLQRRHQFFQESVIPKLSHHEYNPTLLLSKHGIDLSADETVWSWQKDEKLLDPHLTEHHSGVIHEAKTNVHEDLRDGQDISHDRSKLCDSIEDGYEIDIAITLDNDSQTNQHSLGRDNCKASVSDENNRKSQTQRQTNEKLTCRYENPKQEKQDNLNVRFTGGADMENNSLCDTEALNSDECQVENLAKNGSLPRANSKCCSKIHISPPKNNLNDNKDKLLPNGNEEVPQSLDDTSKRETKTEKSEGPNYKSDVKIGNNAAICTNHVSDNDKSQTHRLSRQIERKSSENYTTVNPLTFHSDPISHLKTEESGKRNHDFISRDVDADIPFRQRVKQNERSKHDSSFSKASLRQYTDNHPSSPLSFRHDSTSPSVSLPHHLSRPNTGHQYIAPQIATGNESERPKSNISLSGNTEQSIDKKQDWVILRDYKTTHLGGYGGKYNVWTNNPYVKGHKGQTESTHHTDYRLPAKRYNKSRDSTSKNNTGNGRFLPHVDAIDYNNNNVKEDGPRSHQKGPVSFSTATSDSQLASRLAWKLTEIANRRSKRYHQAREALIPKDVRIPSRPISREKGPARQSGNGADSRPSSRDALMRQQKIIVPFRIRSADLHSTTESPTPIDIVRKCHAVNRGSDHSHRGGMAGKSLQDNGYRDTKAAMAKLQADNFVHNVNQLQAKYSGNSKSQSVYPDPRTQELLDYFWSYQGIGRQILGARSPAQGTIFCKYKSNDEPAKNKELRPLESIAPVNSKDSASTTVENNSSNDGRPPESSDEKNVETDTCDQDEQRKRKKVHLVVKLPGTEQSDED